MSYITESLDCFKNIIQLDGGCSDTPSTSGYYSNEIDIDKDFINQIITRQYKSTQDFFDKKLAFAIKSVVNACITELTPQFRVGTLLSNYRVGFFQENLLQVAGGNLKGINHDLCNSDSYINFYLHELSLQVDVTQDIQVLVYDLIQNKLLDTITVSCVANEVSITYPQKVYSSPRRKMNLIFVYDSTGINSNTTKLKQGGCGTCTGNSRLVNTPYETISAISIGDSDQKIKNNLVRITETGGMSIVHSLSCDHTSWLCSYVNLMAPAILLKYGISVMEFAETVSPNDRINTSVTLNTEEITKRKTNYQAEYNDRMTSILKNINTPSDSKCFECRENIRHAVITQ